MSSTPARQAMAQRRDRAQTPDKAEMPIPDGVQMRVSTRQVALVD